MSRELGACLSEALLARFLERTASSDELAVVTSHVDRCTSCRLVVSGLACTLPDEDVHGTEHPTEPAGPSIGALARGTIIGRFVLLDVIGSGGMGVVYTAYDPDLDRSAALKLLRVQAPSNAANLRLRTEAQLMARIQHPNVVTVHEVGAYREQVYLAMERIDGVTLRRWCAQRRRSWREIVDVMLRAGDGLAAAHEAQIVHGDFKPENVLVAGDQVKVTDFGLAATGAGAVRLVGGTPGYVAPECLVPGKATDARADQYGYAITLYEALCGRPPGEETPAMARVPGVVRPVLRRGLMPDPAARYPSMGALLADLRRRLAVRRRRAFVVPVLAVVAGVGLLLVTRPKRAPAPAPCAHAAAALDSAWSPARARAITDAFAATGRPDAAATAATVVAALERYADRWRAARIATCEATAVRREQSPALLDLRMACLDQLAVRLRVTGDALAQPTPALVRTAVSNVDALPGVDGCADATALLAVTPLPTEATRRTRITAAMTAITEAHASFDVAHADAGARIAEAIRVEVAALDYAPVTARYEYLRARVSSWGKADLAGQLVHLRTAALAAESGGLDRLQVLVLTKAALIATLRGASEDGQRMLEDAQATARRIGMPPSEDRLLESTRSQLARLRGDFAAALVHAERWVSLAGVNAEAHGPTARQLARARVERGQILLSMNRDAEALVDLAAGAAVLDDELGVNHADSATAHVAHALCLEHLGRVHDALVEVDVAYGRIAAATGDDHADLVEPLGIRMRLHARLAHVDLAARLARQRIAIQTAVTGPDSDATRQTELDLAHVYMTTRQWSAADAAAATVLAHRVPPDVTAGRAAFVRAEVAVRRGRVREARRSYESALRVLLVADPAVAADVRAGYGKLLARDAPARAIEMLRAAVDAGSTDVDARATLGTLLYARPRDRARGRALVAEARAACVAAKDGPCSQRLDGWLARHP